MVIFTFEQKKFADLNASLGLTTSHGPNDI